MFLAANLPGRRLETAVVWQKQLEAEEIRDQQQQGTQELVDGSLDNREIMVRCRSVLCYLYFLLSKEKNKLKPIISTQQ